MLLLQFLFVFVFSTGAVCGRRSLRSPIATSRTNTTSPCSNEQTNTIYSSNPQSSSPHAQVHSPASIKPDENKDQSVWTRALFLGPDLAMPPPQNKDIVNTITDTSTMFESNEASDNLLPENLSTTVSSPCNGAFAPKSTCNMKHIEEVKTYPAGSRFVIACKNC